MYYGPTAACWRHWPACAFAEQVLRVVGRPIVPRIERRRELGLGDRRNIQTKNNLTSEPKDTHTQEEKKRDKTHHVFFFVGRGNDQRRRLPAISCSTHLEQHGAPNPSKLAVKLKHARPLPATPLQSWFAACPLRSNPMLMPLPHVPEWSANMPSIKLHDPTNTSNV